MKRYGYGVLNLKPDELFSLSPTEFFDMVNAKLSIRYVQEDKAYERTAWATSLQMTATGNYGKKGIDPTKLYKRKFDELGDPLPETVHGAFTPVDKEEKDNKLNELIAKFNK